MKTLTGGNQRAARGLGGALTLALVISVLTILAVVSAPANAAPLPGGSLDPLDIPKYQEPLVIPPAMPRTQVITAKGKQIDYYEIAVKQFEQYILPMGWSQTNAIGPTTVWSYGSMRDPRPVAEGGTLNYPALTIEAMQDRPVRVKWINGLVDESGNYLPHLFAVDQTLHWANPAAGPGMTDMEGTDQTPYTGPVPIVTHVHGAHTTQDSDGYPEAWYLPAANNIPAGYATGGMLFDQFKQESEARWGQTWEPGSAVFQYPNDQRATTLWYHDHALGITRLNVYAGPAGFYLLRKSGDKVARRLPRPAPQRGDKPGKKYYEIPLAIQDRSFNADGSLFYPDNRAFFEGLNVPGRPPQFAGPPPAPELRIPFIPEPAADGQESDISPIWNPEFFGNTMVVNGKTWPYLNVEQRRYRFRVLNGSQSRFLILRMSNSMPFTQIGSEGGYLPKPVKLRQLLIAPAERADVIVDFSKVRRGTRIVLRNLGPDEPFGGGKIGQDFAPSDPSTTGQVMQFRVRARSSRDVSASPSNLRLPGIKRLPTAANVRDVSLNELDSASVRVSSDADGNVVFDPAGEPFGPAEATLGTWTPAGAQSLEWDDPITENPAVGAVEAWNLRNFTMDAHPIHIHLVQFQVVRRVVTDPMMSPHGMKDGVMVEPGTVIKPERWETGWKDTVIVYPGELTRVKARFDMAGLFVWHCHILEHEDNEMMRPYRVGSAPPMSMLSTSAED